MERSAFRLFLRDVLKQSLETELPDELLDAARAALARVEVPKVTFTTETKYERITRSAVVQIVFARPSEIWRLARDHVERVRFLRIGNEEPSDAAPNVSLKEDGEIVVHDPDLLVVTPADAEVPEEALREANQLAGYYARRREHVTNVVACVVRHQLDFLRGRTEKPVPLTLVSLATELEMHPSTVGRRLHGLRLEASGRVHALEDVVAMIASRVPDEELDRIGGLIKGMVEAEDPTQPLSDLLLSRRLSEQGVKVPRRTVAKCRERLGIVSSARRRR